MVEEKNQNTLGLLLRELLKERSLSMRKLSELTEIDTATISRIINGKRRANPQHLVRFADCLGIPLIELFEATGYPVEQKQETLHLPSYTYTDIIQNFFETSHLANMNVSVAVVEQQLANYEQYAQTAEGKTSILKGFEEKLESVGTIGPLINQMKDLFGKFRLRKGTPVELALIGGVLLYFIIPVDAIPDYLFAFGYLDDAIAVQITANALEKK